jgi:hypothetical protein
MLPARPKKKKQTQVT